jgi:hypothetical protein
VLVGIWVWLCVYLLFLRQAQLGRAGHPGLAVFRWIAKSQVVRALDSRYFRGTLIDVYVVSVLAWLVQRHHS